MAVLSSLIFVLLTLLRWLTGPSRLVHKYVDNLTEEHSSGTLEIIDYRTGRRYKIPVANNAIEAVHLGVITANNSSSYTDRIRHGLRVLDPGFRNTAVAKSCITLV